MYDVKVSGAPKPIDGQTKAAKVIIEDAENEYKNDCY
jgi:hypothetical protein